MVLPISIKKLPILYISWIFLGSIGVIYHLLYFWRLWGMKGVADYSPDIIYIFLFAAISIIIFISGIAGLARKKWSNIILAIVSVILIVYSIVSIIYLVSIIVTNKPAEYQSLIVSSVINIIVFIISLFTIWGAPLWLDRRGLEGSAGS